MARYSTKLEHLGVFLHSTIPTKYLDILLFTKHPEPSGTSTAATAGGTRQFAAPLEAKKTPLQEPRIYSGNSIPMPPKAVGLELLSTCST